MASGVTAFLWASRLMVGWREGGGAADEMNPGQGIGQGTGRSAGLATGQDAGVRRLAGNLSCIRLAYADREYTCGISSLLGFSFLVAVIGTAYGIGGGTFMVPLCLVVYRLPIHAIAGATLAATFITSGFALAAYAWLATSQGVSAGPDWLLGLAFGGGGLVGAYLGARLQRHVSQRWLKGLLGLLLLGLAVSYAWPAVAGLLITVLRP